MAGVIENSTTTTTDEVAAAFSYETMHSFLSASRVRLQQTSAAADISDSYSVSAACMRHFFSLYSFHLGYLVGATGP